MRPARPAFSLKKPIAPRTFGGDAETLVTRESLAPDRAFPLVYRPRVDDLDLDRWLETNRTRLMEELHRVGAILFRGFSIPTPEAFQDFAAKVCPDLYRNYGDLPRENDTIYKVTPYPHDDTILFHNESSHMGSWPLKQLFYCHEPAAAGGETPIVDCRVISREMDPALLEKFERLQLKYTRNFIPKLDVRWQDFFRTEDPAVVEEKCRANDWHFEWKPGGQLTLHQHSPAVTTHPVTGEKIFFNQIQLHHIAFLKPHIRQSLLEMVPEADLPRNVYFGDGSVLEDQVVRDIEALYWKHAAEFTWQAGDVLIVDNMLVSHARKPYQPPRKMNVAMGDMQTAVDRVAAG